MRHLIIYIIALLLFPLSISAKGVKNPKFFKKARTVQLTILAYDKEGKIIQGQGYFAGEDHDVMVEYSLLKNAVQVKAVDASGKEYGLKRVKGANSLYNIARLSCSTPDRFPQPMPLLADALAVGSVVYVMPLCNNEKDAACFADTIAKVETFEEGHNYYTLTAALDERLSGAPVFTEQGELIGSVQLSADEKAKHGYILSVTYPLSLTIAPVDINKYDLRSLLIPRQIPADEEQATTFLYLSNKKDTLIYRANVEDFVAQFPTNSTGYIQLAELEASLGHYTKAEAVYADGLSHCTESREEIHHSFAKLLYQSGLRNEPLAEGWTMDKALEHANAAYEAKPLPIFIALQGMILYGQQNYSDACQKFIEMSQTNMRSAEYFLYASQCKQMMSSPAEEILALQDSAVACYSKPYPKEVANCLYLRAKTLATLNRFREAVSDLNEYEHLLSANVSDAFYYEREQLEMQCRMFQQALNDIDRAVALQPQEPLYYAEQAAVNYRVGQVDQALEAAQKAVKLDDTFADAYRILGICLNEKGKKTDARKALQKAIELGDEMAQTVLDKMK